MPEMGEKGTQGQSEDIEEGKKRHWGWIAGARDGKEMLGWKRGVRDGERMLEMERGSQEQREDAK